MALCKTTVSPLLTHWGEIKFINLFWVHISCVIITYTLEILQSCTETSIWHHRTAKLSPWRSLHLIRCHKVSLMLAALPQSHGVHSNTVVPGSHSSTPSHTMDNTSRRLVQEWRNSSAFALELRLSWLTHNIAHSSTMGNTHVMESLWYFKSWKFIEQFREY